MTAIRVIFDGKTFIPQQPVSLPAQSEAMVLVDSVDQAERKRLDDEVRAYYQNGGDSEDDDWGAVTERDSHLAWDED